MACMFVFQLWHIDIAILKEDGTLLSNMKERCWEMPRLWIEDALLGIPFPMGVRFLEFSFPSSRVLNNFICFLDSSSIWTCHSDMKSCQLLAVCSSQLPWFLLFPSGLVLTIFDFRPEGSDDKLSFFQFSYQKSTWAYLVLHNFESSNMKLWWSNVWRQLRLSIGLGRQLHGWSTCWVSMKTWVQTPKTYVKSMVGQAYGASNQEAQAGGSLGLMAN